jgi:hypothetical protein
MNKLRTEPVMLLAVLVAVVQAVCTFVAGGGALTAAALVPIVAGALARALVMPADGSTLTHPASIDGAIPGPGTVEAISGDAG